MYSSSKFRVESSNLSLILTKHFFYVIFHDLTKTIQTTISAATTIPTSEDMTKQIVKVFNVERHAMEAKELRKKVGKSSLKDHLESKEYARDSVRTLRRKISI